MTMVFDYSSQQIYQFFLNSTEFPALNYASEVETLTVELDEILTEKNVTLLTLMESIAINCTSFIAFCELHSKFINQDECCKIVFDSRPFFSREGTCFTTKQRIIETTPYAFSSVKLWVHTEIVPAPGMHCPVIGCNIFGIVKTFSPHIQSFVSDTKGQGQRRTIILDMW